VLLPIVMAWFAINEVGADLAEVDAITTTELEASACGGAFVTAVCESSDVGISAVGVAEAFNIDGEVEVVAEVEVGVEVKVEVEVALELEFDGNIDVADEEATVNGIAAGDLSAGDVDEADGWAG
jgi:hypothetical protein